MEMILSSRFIYRVGHDAVWNDHQQVIPDADPREGTEAGIQPLRLEGACPQAKFWTPAFAGVTHSRRAREKGTRELFARGKESLALPSGPPLDYSPRVLPSSTRDRRDGWDGRRNDRFAMSPHLGWRPAPPNTQDILRATWSPFRRLGQGEAA